MRPPFRDNDSERGNKFRLESLLVMICFVLIASWPSKSAALELVEKAKSWVKTLNVLNSNPENCDDPLPGGARVPARAISAPATRKPAPPPEPPNPNYKSEKDLREYFKCYLDNPNHLKDTLEKYIPLINSAAQAYDIPPTLLGCLLFRESMFKIDAKSKSGALGLSQQLKKNLNYLSNVLTFRTEKEAKEIEETAARSPEEHRQARENQISLAIAKSEVQQAKSRRKSLRLMKRWEAYYQDLFDKKLVRKGPIPRKLNASNIVEDPAIAIGTGAMYLRDILITFRTTFDSRVQVDQAGIASDPELLLAAAGAYNMGAGGESKNKSGQLVQSGAFKFIKPVVRQGYGTWVKALTESNEETAAHIVSIKNCIEPKKSESQNDPWQPPIGTAPRDCANPVEGKYEVLPGKRPLELPDSIQQALKRNNAPASAARASSPKTKNKTTTGSKKNQPKPKPKPKKEAKK